MKPGRNLPVPTRGAAFQHCQDPPNRAMSMSRISFRFFAMTSPSKRFSSRHLAAVLFAGLLFGVAAMQAESVAGPVAEDIFPQLRPILEQAMTQAPTMIQRNIELAQSEASVYLNAAALWPQLSGGASYSINSSAIAARTDVSSRSSGVYYNLALSQPVFQWGTLKAQADSAKISVRISEKNYAEAYRNLLLTLRSQYLGLIVKKLAVRNAEFSRKVTESTLAATEEKLRSGAISPGEIIAFKLAADEARLILERTQEDLSNALRFFCHIAGCRELTADDIPSEMSQTVFAADPARSAQLLARFEHDGLEKTYQALSYRYQITQAELTYKIAKFRLYPRFAFSAIVSQSNQTNASVDIVTQTGVYSQSVSLTANWNIFDGFATKGAKLSALAQKRTAERQLKTYLESTLDQVKYQAKLAEFAARALTLADTRRNLIEAAVKRAKEEFIRGVGSQASVDGATVAFHQTELTAYSSRADYLSRVAELASLLGEDPLLAKLPGRYTSHE